MSSVNFNQPFGMNVKTTQEMQKLKFGSNVRSTSNNNSQTSFNASTSIFNLNNTQLQNNPFNTNRSVSGSVTQSQIAKANALWDQADTVMMKSTNTASNIQRSTRTPVMARLKNFTGKMFGRSIPRANQYISNLRTGYAKSAGSAKAVNDVKNANDKNTLKETISTLNAVKDLTETIGKEATNFKKTAETNQKQAALSVKDATQQLTNDNKKLEQDKKTLDSAKQATSNAQGRVDTATKSVEEAEAALKAAKQAKTKDNPNTDAISNAKAELKKAKNEKKAAEKELKEAQKQEKQAQTEVDTQTKKVADSETALEQAKTAETNAKKEVTQANTEVQTNQKESQDIDAGLKEGEQRLENMENKPAEDNPEVNNNQSQAETIPENQTETQTPADPNAPSDPFAKSRYEENNDMIENMGYSDEEKAQMYNAREQIRNMKPGDTVQCGNDIYEMNEKGQISVNGNVMEITGAENPQEIIAENGINSVQNKIKLDKKRTTENAALEQTQSSKQKPKPEQTNSQVSNNTQQQKTETVKQDTPIQETPKEEVQNETISENNSQTASENNGISPSIDKDQNGYYVNNYSVSEEQYNAALAMDQDVVSAGFNPGSACDIEISDGESVSFEVSNGQYKVNGKEVDSKTFLAEFNKAKEAGEKYDDSGNNVADIRLTGNDDYSKYKKIQK